MKQDNPKKSIYKVQALERALDIIDCFSFQDRELSLTDVVKRTGLNKTTAKRLMSNLSTRGYLQQDPQSKKYQLGMRLFELGGADAFSLRLEQIRDQGYILEKEEAVEGVIGIAAPIRDYSRQVVAALGIGLPAGSRNQMDGLDRIVDLVKKTCETISSDLGYLRI